MFNKYENYERVYFSVADRQLENFLNEDAFERSLLLNALFQPAILIPDVFFFISRGLERHIFESSTPQSLLEACIANGVVIPAFRNPSCSSFNEALYIIRGKGDPKRAIRGLRDPQSNDRIANRLQVAARSKDFLLAYWPQHDVGEKFDQVIERYLVRPEPPQADMYLGINQKYLNTLWKLTERWRLDCVYEAREETRKIAQRGLRRGEIMNAVGRDLGLPSDCQVNDIAELLEIPLESPEKKQALRVFLRWMCELYQYNQAVEFGTTPNFPNYDPLSGIVISSAFTEAPSQVELSSFPTIREGVSLPPMKILLHISPTELIRVRNEKGPAYFAALRAWQYQPNEAHEREVRHTLQQYCKEIFEWSMGKQDFSTAILDVLLGSCTTPAQKILRPILSLGGTVVSIYQPWVAPFIILSGVGYAIYLWRTHREDTLIKTTTPNAIAKIPPEVNFQGISVDFDS